MPMRKYFYFESNKENEKTRGKVTVCRRQWHTVCVTVETSGLGGFMMGSELTPEEARQMAAGLLNLADEAERDAIEQGLA